MAQSDYERIGRLIFGAFRRGANKSDIVNWIADDLGMARPDSDDDVASASLYNAFVTRYISDDEFQTNCERFFEQLKS